MNMREVNELLMMAAALRVKVSTIEVSEGTKKELTRAMSMMTAAMQMVEDDKDEMIQNLAMRLAEDSLAELDIDKATCLSLLQYAGRELSRLEELADRPETDKRVVDIIDDYSGMIQNDLSAIVGAIESLRSNQLDDDAATIWEDYADVSGAMHTVKEVNEALGKETVQA